MIAMFDPAEFEATIRRRQSTLPGRAVACCSEHPGAKLLAGGHSLIPLMKLRLAAPAALIDIGRIAELKGIGVTGGRVRIGALTTHAELAASDALRRSCPMLAEAAAQVGDPQVRNRGTIGGNVAHADPASDLPTVLVGARTRGSSRPDRAASGRSTPATSSRG